MKIYLVWVTSAGTCQVSSSLHGIFDTKEKAEERMKEVDSIFTKYYPTSVVLRKFVEETVVE